MKLNFLKGQNWKTGCDLSSRSHKSWEGLWSSESSIWFYIWLLWCGNEGSWMHEVYCLLGDVNQVLCRSINTEVEGWRIGLVRLRDNRRKKTLTRGPELPIHLASNGLGQNRFLPLSCSVQVIQHLKSLVFNIHTWIGLSKPIRKLNSSSQPVPLAGPAGSAL